MGSAPCGPDFATFHLRVTSVALRHAAAAPTVGSCRCWLPRSWSRSGSTTSTGCRRRRARRRWRWPHQTLERAGVQAAIVDCSGLAPATPCKTGLAEGEMILRIHRHPKDGVHVLGEAIVHGASGPNTVATVYAAAIAERARRDGTSLATIVGRVSAHEIGHLLLGTNAHATHGLMRASWDAAADRSRRLGLHASRTRRRSAAGCSRTSRPASWWRAPIPDCWRCRPQVGTRPSGARRRRLTVVSPRLH